jgi:hypothetical protein
MKKGLILLTGSALIISLLAACNTTSETNDREGQADTAAIEDLPPISIKPVGGSPEFPDASLAIKNVNAVLKGKDSVTITINYDVQNYELKSQTSDAAGKGCNNSKDGQHIHFILDDNAYTALYAPTHTFTLPVGSEHYVMSFLSRSYHESLKNPKAAVLYRFSVNDKGVLSKLEIPKTPMVFYSRPKGDYLGDDTKNVLLDFYVYQATLAPDAYKVKANISGKDFELNKWEPYFIEHLPMGDATVTLQLIDNAGKAVEGVHTSARRTITLAQEEPIR